MEEKRSSGIANQLLLAIHDCWKDSNFNLRKSRLLADHPGAEEDETVQFFLETLEQAAEKQKSLEKMFRFAVMCRIGTFSPEVYGYAGLALYQWGHCNQAASLAFSGLTAYLNREDALLPLKAPDPPTDNTRRKYSGEQNHEGVTEALKNLIWGIPYLDKREEVEQMCRVGLKEALQYNGPLLPYEPYRWFLPICAQKAEVFGSAPQRSDIGTNAELTFGILLKNKEEET